MNKSISTRFIVQVNGCREVWATMEQAIAANPDRIVYREDTYAVYQPSGTDSPEPGYISGPEAMRGKC